MAGICVVLGRSRRQLLLRRSLLGFLVLVLVVGLGELLLSVLLAPPLSLEAVFRIRNKTFGRRVPCGLATLPMDVVEVPTLIVPILIPNIEGG